MPSVYHGWTELKRAVRANEDGARAEAPHQMSDASGEQVRDRDDAASYFGEREVLVHRHLA